MLGRIKNNSQDNKRPIEIPTNTTTFLTDSLPLILNNLDTKNKMNFATTCKFFNHFLFSKPEYLAEIQLHKSNKTKKALDTILRDCINGINSYHNAGVAGNTGNRRRIFYQALLGIGNFAEYGTSATPLIKLAGLYSILYIEGGTQLKQSIMTQLTSSFKNLSDKNFKEMLEKVVEHSFHISPPMLQALAKNIYDLQGNKEIKSNIITRYNGTKFSIYQQINNESALSTHLNAAIRTLENKSFMQKNSLG